MRCICLFISAALCRVWLEFSTANYFLCVSSCGWGGGRGEETKIELHPPVAILCQDSLDRKNSLSSRCNLPLPSSQHFSLTPPLPSASILFHSSSTSFPFMLRSILSSIHTRFIDPFLPFPCFSHPFIPPLLNFPFSLLHFPPFRSPSAQYPFTFRTSFHLEHHFLSFSEPFPSSSAHPACAIFFLIRPLQFTVSAFSFLYLCLLFIPFSTSLCFPLHP
jgi:hypothetical protein